MRKIDKLLFSAVAACDTEQVSSLLKHKGVNVNIATRPDKTTLLMISARNNDVKMLRLLLEYGAKVGASDFLGRNAIDLAEKYGATDALFVLLTYCNEGDTCHAC